MKERSKVWNGAKNWTQNLNSKSQIYMVATNYIIYFALHSLALHNKCKSLAFTPLFNMSSSEIKDSAEYSSNMTGITS